jgi:hypothetical protein
LKTDPKLFCDSKCIDEVDAKIQSAKLLEISFCGMTPLKGLLVSLATGPHLIPSRTQKLSPSAAMVVQR